MLVREIILENFMSYEYARIPFKPGLNVVCGPNGSGKSSILLGISVALGQSYTERSKKLSDLIRWGKDQARVTLVLDNSREGNWRPIPKIKKDYIFLTRVLRRDGRYWFELENKAATKTDVERLLSKLGVDPDNMLIIMHQNMVEQFVILSPQEKLKVVEEAVGFESYRRNVMDAQRKLSRILSEEESIDKLLESAQQTLNYWREQYDRYQQKKQLVMKRQFLERELAWAEVAKRENIILETKEQIRKEQSENSQIENKIKAANEQLNRAQIGLESLKAEWQKCLEEQLSLEREYAKHDVSVFLARQFLEETQSWAQAHNETISGLLNKIEKLESTLHEKLSTADSRDPMNDIKVAYKHLEGWWNQKLSLKTRELKELIENSNRQIAALKTEVSNAHGRVDRLNFEMEDAYKGLVDCKIDLALLRYRKESIEKILEKRDRELQSLLLDLDKSMKRAEETGPRIVPTKSVEELFDEIRITDGHLAALADVSEDIERMYESYSKLYLELKEKARLVAENREKALREVETRIEVWRTVLQNLLNRVNTRYQTILSRAQAVGEVALINEHDMEAAGIDIRVGFKGAEPMPLNAYTQSGGERSTATMVFLLALQQDVRSPFRAVDEYDVHMDPKNREIIADLIVSSVRGLNAQYLAITPSQITFTEKDVHIIAVQNVEGTSLAKEVV